MLEDYLLSEREQKNLAILELIRRRGPITRTEISQGTDLNIVTVSNYVSGYIKRGLVVERGLDVSTGGRKPALVELDNTAAYTIGVDLGNMGKTATDVVAVLADLAGHQKDRVVRSRGQQTIEEVLAQAGDVIGTLLDQTTLDRKLIQGIGMGVAGVIDEPAGTVRDTCPGGIRASYVAVRDQLEQRFQMPVFIGNDATLAGLGEMRLGLSKAVKNMIYMYSDVGAGLIVHGSIYWGSSGSAGEVGIPW